MPNPISTRELLERPDPVTVPPTDDELREIRVRCDRATPGGWVAAEERHGLTIGGPVCYMDEDESIVVGTAGDWGATNDPSDDARFIAHARIDVPRLLHEVERLRELLGAPDRDRTDCPV